MATFTKTQLKQIIKEEYSAVMNETDNMFGERMYDRSLVSNVSKTLQWEIDQAFNFILDLLEDVNAHGEYDAVKKVFSNSIDMGGGFEEGTKASSQTVTEGNNEVSKLITKLELVLNTVDGATGYIENEAALERFQKALDLGQELWEDMHDLLDDGSKDRAEADAFAQSKYALQETAKETK